MENGELQRQYMRSGRATEINDRGFQDVSTVKWQCSSAYDQDIHMMKSFTVVLSLVIYFFGFQRS